MLHYLTRPFAHPLGQPFIDDEHVLQVWFPVQLPTHPFLFCLLLILTNVYFANISLLTFFQSLFPSRHYALFVPAIFLFAIASVALLFAARVLSRSSTLL